MSCSGTESKYSIEFLLGPVLELRSKGLVCDAVSHLTVFRLRGCHRSWPNSILTFHGRPAFCNKNIQIIYIFSL